MYSACCVASLDRHMPASWPLRRLASLSPRTLLVPTCRMPQSPLPLHDAITALAVAVRTVTPAAARSHASPFAASRARAWVHKLCVHMCARVLAREIDCHIVRFFYEGNLQ